MAANTILDDDDVGDGAGLEAADITLGALLAKLLEALNGELGPADELGDELLVISNEAM